jgi:hypothetical protein
LIQGESTIFQNAMHVIDSEPAFWFLLQDGEDLFLDVHCNVSFFSYSVLVPLTPEEAADYRARGRSSISALAERVQETGPPGEYQKRDVSATRGDAVHAAVLAWRASTA